MLRPYASDDLEFADVQLKRGEPVTAALLAADHDMTRFPEPERLDISRAPGQGEQHLAFGAGPHYCLGAALARMQAEIAWTPAVVPPQWFRARGES
ncbi:cytochrome P450 [Nocardia sp. NPDC060256]|uniref:cytochrome P450 n=1 Tax=unclassified Nocardia TaxID=2637762 RepID=UPI00365A6C48